MFRTNDVCLMCETTGVEASMSNNQIHAPPLLWDKLLGLLLPVISTCKNHNQIFTVLATNNNNNKRRGIDLISSGLQVICFVSHV